MRKGFYIGIIAALFTMFFITQGFCKKDDKRKKNLIKCIKSGKDVEKCYEEYRKEERFYREYLECLSKTKHIDAQKQYHKNVRYHMASDHSFKCWAEYSAKLNSKKFGYNITPYTPEQQCKRFRVIYKEGQITMDILRTYCETYCARMKRYYKFRNYKSPWPKPTLNQVMKACKEQLKGPASKKTKGSKYIYF